MGESLNKTKMFLRAKIEGNVLMEIFILVAKAIIVWLVFILITIFLFRAVARWKTLLWRALISIIGIVPAVLQLFDPHELVLNVSTVSAEPLLSSPYSIWLSRLSTLGIWYLSLLGIAYGLFVRRSLPVAGLKLWLGAILFALGPLVASVAGTQPTFNRPLLFLPAVFTTVYLLPTVPLPWFVAQVKQVILFYLYGSLLIAIIAPTWACDLNYTGFIPGLNIRLAGLTQQPNILGPLPVLYLLLDWFMPTKGLWRWLNWGSALLVLLLTQSKTCWAIMMILSIFKLGYELWQLPKKQLGYLILLSCTGVVIFQFSLNLIFADIGLNSFLNSDKVDSLSTLTGRTRVWDITLETWKQNPLFGYGPDLWSPSFRSEFNLPWVGQAHNQFLQSLGESGLIGFGGLLIYIFILLIYAFRYLQFTRGISLAVVMLPLIQSVSEDSFNIKGGNPTAFKNFVIFSLLLLLTRQTRKVMNYKGHTSNCADELSQLAIKNASKSISTV